MVRGHFNCLVCNKVCSSKEKDWFAFKIGKKPYYIHIFCHVKLILALSGYEDLTEFEWPQTSRLNSSKLN